MKNEHGWIVELVIIVAFIMLIFPPTYSTDDGGDMYFRGYKFVASIKSYEFIEWGRLSLQFVFLGLSWFALCRWAKKFNLKNIKLYEE